MISQLDMKMESFALLKKLILHFGIYILPFLKVFYSRIQDVHENEFESQLKYLASLAREMIEDKEIDELKFLYEYGFSDVLIKKQNKEKECERNR